MLNYKRPPEPTNLKLQHAACADINGTPYRGDYRTVLYGEEGELRTSFEVGSLSRVRSIGELWMRGRVGLGVIANDLLVLGRAGQPSPCRSHKW